MRLLFKGFHQGCRGFGLLELSISMAIGGLLTGGLVTSIYQIVSLPPKIETNSILTQQAQNVSYWMSRDAQMVQTFAPGDNPQSPETEILTLSWVCVKRTDAQDNDSIDTFTVRYSHDSSRLYRHEKIHTDTYSSNGNMTGSSEIQKKVLVAENVTEITGSILGSAVKISAVFSYNGKELVRNYEVTPRANTLN